MLSAIRETSSRSFHRNCFRKCFFFCLEIRIKSVFRLPPVRSLHLRPASKHRIPSPDLFHRLHALYCELEKKSYSSDRWENASWGTLLPASNSQQNLRSIGTISHAGQTYASMLPRLRLLNLWQLNSMYLKLSSHLTLTDHNELDIIPLRVGFYSYWQIERDKKRKRILLGNYKCMS